MRILKPTLLLIVVILLPFMALSAQTGQKNASRVIEMIIGHTDVASIPNTVDVIKTGDPLTPVTGIVTTMFATMDVLKKAVAMKCNLIIVHEPLFYNHLDETAQFDKSSVYLEKRRFIDENKLVIFRFHDYIHSMQPDGINYGMTLKLGWEKYANGPNYNRYIIPETTLKDLLGKLKNAFPGNTFNVVGDPALKLTKVAFAAGAPGSAAHFRLLDDDNVELVLAGEVPQWETYEYARDAVIQGKKKAIIFMGHVTSEESGMDYCATWLKKFLEDIPVTFIPVGPSYWTY
jgi:putative NIF3 family GTP cyclohydrolase 1 type 2